LEAKLDENLYEHLLGLRSLELKVTWLIGVELLGKIDNGCAEDMNHYT